MEQIQARLIKLPLSVSGISCVDENGEPMIYLNDRLSFEQQRKTYAHEMGHIKRDDFHNGLPIEVVEGVQSAPRFEKTAPPIKRRPKKKASKPQTPQQHLEEHLTAAKRLLPIFLTPWVDHLFSHPPETVREIYMRGWVLYAITPENAVWSQLLMTYALYGTGDLPRRQSREAKEVTGRTISYELMKRVMYALTQTV